MAQSCTPPPLGSPVWLEIPALDVERAKSFYTSVFSWPFQPATTDYPPHKLAMFAYPECQTGGGITLVEGGGQREAMERRLADADVDADGGKSAAAGGMRTFFRVASVEETLEKIEKAGGRVVRGKEMEGNHGRHAVFADTEENRAAVYEIKDGGRSA